MTTFTLYHNPRCSKSLKALQLLQENNITYETVNYVDNPLNAEQITQLLTKLQLKAADLIRKNEQIYTDLNLKNASEEQLIIAMTENPKLIERPIIANKNSAIIGRPPPKILEFCLSFN